MEGKSAEKRDKKSKPSFWHRLTGQSRKRNLKDKTTPPPEIALTRADKIYSSLRHPQTSEIRKASSDTGGGSTSDQDLYRTLDSSGMADVHNDAGILFLNDKVLRLKSGTPKAPERHVQFAPTPLNKYYYDWEPRRDNNPSRKSLLPDKENVHPGGVVSGSRSILRNRESGDFSRKNADVSSKTVRTNQEEVKLLKVRQMIIEARAKQTPSFPRTSTRLQLKNNQNVPSPDFNESVILTGHVEETKKHTRVGGFLEGGLNSEHKKNQNVIVRHDICRSSMVPREGNKRGSTEATQFQDKYDTNLNHVIDPQNTMPFSNFLYRDKPDIQTASNRRISKINVGTSQTGSNHESYTKAKPYANGFTASSIMGHQRSENMGSRLTLKEKPPVTTYQHTTSTNSNAPFKQQAVVASRPEWCSVQSINSYPYSVTRPGTTRTVAQDNDLLPERVVNTPHNTGPHFSGLHLASQTTEGLIKEVWVDKKPDQKVQTFPCPKYIPPQKINQLSGPASFQPPAVIQSGYIPQKAIEFQNIPLVTNQRLQGSAVEIMNRKANKTNDNCRTSNAERKVNIITSSPCNPQGKTLPKGWKYQQSVKRKEDGMSSMADDECSLNCSCATCTHRFVSPLQRGGSTRQLERNYFFPHIPNANSITANRKYNFGKHEEKNDAGKDGEKTSVEENREPCSKTAIDQNQETQTDVDPPPTSMWYEFEDSSCKSPSDQKVSGNPKLKPISENENIYSNESLSKIIEKAVRETLERLIASNTAPMLRTPHKSKSLEYMTDSTKNTQSPIYMNLEVYRSTGDGASAVSATFSSTNTDTSVRTRSPLKCSVVLPADTSKFDFSPSQLTVLQQTFQKLLLECGALNRKQMCLASSSENVEEAHNDERKREETVDCLVKNNQERVSLAPDLKHDKQLQTEAPVGECAIVCDKENYLDAYPENEPGCEDQSLSTKISSKCSNSCDYQRSSITHVNTSSGTSEIREKSRNVKGNIRYKRTHMMQSQSLPDLSGSINQSKINSHSRSTVSLVHCCGPANEATENLLTSYEASNKEVQKDLSGNSHDQDDVSLPSRHSPDGWDKTPTTDNSSAYSTMSGSSCSSSKDDASNDISGSTEKDLELLEDVKRLGMGFPPVPKTKKSPVRFRSPTKITKFKAKDVLSGKAKLKLSIYHNAGLVTVHVMRAAKLTSSHAKVLNPYVKVSLVPDETRRTHWRTSVVKGQRNPVFDEKFSFEIISDDSSKRIVFSVWHRDYTNQRSELLGCMSFGLHHVMDTSQCINGWYRLLREAIGTQKHFAVNPKKNRFIVQNTGFLGIVSKSCLV